MPSKGPPLEDSKLEAGLEPSGLTKGFVPVPGALEALSVLSKMLRLPSVLGVPGRRGVGALEVAAEGTGGRP